MLRTADKRLQVGQGLRDMLTNPHSRYGDALNIGTELYVALVMEDAPRAFWKMQEESGLPQDSSGNGLHLTSVVGTVDYQWPGPMGDYSIRCQGGETLNRSSHVSTVRNGFTIEMIVSVEDVTANDQTLFHNGNVGSNGWGIAVDSNGTFQGLAGGVAFLASSSVVIEGAGFVHLVVKKESGTSGEWTYWVNGVQDGGSKGTSNPNTPSGTVVMGASSIQTAYSYVAVYETALSQARIEAHAAATGL